MRGGGAAGGRRVESQCARPVIPGAGNLYVLGPTAPTVMAGLGPAINDGAVPAFRVFRVVGTAQSLMAGRARP